MSLFPRFHLAQAARAAHPSGVQLELRSPVLDEVVVAIRSFIAKQNTLHDVVVAGLTSRPERRVCNVVVQDEYTHDVVVRWDDALFLVYDTT